jgi:hypothetical protein
MPTIVYKYEDGVGNIAYKPDEIVLCCDYLYCLNKNCSKKHWGMKNYSSRLYRFCKDEKNSTAMDNKIEERMALYRAIDKLKKNGKKVLVI